MRKLTLTFIIVSFASTLFAQSFEVPQNCKLDKAEDYATYEQDILNCINWLSETSPDQETGKRKKANAFLLKWLTGSPTVHLDIKVEIVTFFDNGDLLMIFMGGWAKYSLESKDYDNKIEGSKAGIEAVILFYQKNISVLKKDKNVEKYIKMKEKGKLDEYIKKNA